ncbi:MAG: hypothetical protein ACTHUB_04065 [Leuconostoc mesenteroides]
MANTKFYVTNILNDTDIIITGGKEDGFHPDDEFKIVDENEEKIINPKTKEVLDTVERYKDRLVVKEIHEKYTVLTSRTTVQVSVSSLAALDVSAYNKMSKNRSFKETLVVNQNQKKDILNPYSFREISVGDAVVKE